MSEFHAICLSSSGNEFETIGIGLAIEIGKLRRQLFELTVYKRFNFCSPDTIKPTHRKQESLADARVTRDSSAYMKAPMVEI